MSLVDVVKIIDQLGVPVLPYPRPEEVPTEPGRLPRPHAPWIPPPTRDPGVSPENAPGRGAGGQEMASGGGAGPSLTSIPKGANFDPLGLQRAIDQLRASLPIGGVYLLLFALFILGVVMLFNSAIPTAQAVQNSDVAQVVGGVVTKRRKAREAEDKASNAKHERRNKLHAQGKSALTV